MFKHLIVPAVLLLKTKKFYKTMKTTLTKAKWALDASHSEVQFKVKHMVISTLTGKFKVFGGELETNSDDLSDAKAKFSVDVSTIDTNNDDRDAHLKSDDFFASEKFPEMKFVSTSFKKVDNDEYEVEGDLTIRDITKRIKFDAGFGGIITDPYGNKRLGFEVDGKINRKDFGLAWSALTETGGLVVSDDVKMHINVEFIRQ